jgi:peptide/nickel transport system permease protein
MWVFGALRAVGARLIRLVIVFLLVTFVSFALLSRLPGDLCIAQLGFNAGVPGLLDRCRHGYGLDRSLVVQYVDWLHHIVTGNLGHDPISRRPMSLVLGMRLGRTVEIMIITTALSVVIGTVLGLVMGYRQSSKIDRVLSAPKTHMRKPQADAATGAMSSSVSPSANGK